MKFQIQYMREVRSYDLYEEEIEADTQLEAEAIAQIAASEFNSDCPEGLTQGDANCDYWEVCAVTATK